MCVGIRKGWAAPRTQRATGRKWPPRAERALGDLSPWLWKLLLLYPSVVFKTAPGRSAPWELIGTTQR